jgi:hypothetical protein
MTAASEPAASAPPPPLSLERTVPLSFGLDGWLALGFSPSSEQLIATAAIARIASVRRVTRANVA